MMKKIVLMLFLSLLSVSLVMAGGQQEPEQPAEVKAEPAKDAIVLKLAHADSTNIYQSRKHAQAVTFASLVNNNSGGKINVQIYGAGALGGEREYIEACMSGTVEAGIASGPIASFYPEAMVTDIPYLFPSSNVAWKVLDGPFGEKLSKGFMKQTGLRNLAFAEVGFRNFTNDVRPIRKPSDLKGLKIRVMETPLYVNMVKALGASPTPIAWPEVYTALQTGVVDGEENPIGTILMANFPEVQKYVTLDGHVYGVDWFFINEDFFQSLSPELKYIVQDAARISSGVGRGVINAINAVGVSTMAEQGMEVYVPTEAEKEMFKDATQGPVIEWMKTQVDPTLIKEVLREVDRVVSEEKADLR